MIRINESRKITVAIYTAIFAFMLLCNILSLKIADDYAYCYSWADGHRITRVFDIIPSMAAHAQTMNGRLVAHAMAQLFLMLPAWIFDIVNSLVFILQIVLISRIARGGKERNNLLSAGIFCAIWLYELAFGQVNLWLDGACNYLWSVSIGLLWIQSYVHDFTYDSVQSRSLGRTILFLILSAMAGGYGESASAAFIFIAAVLMGLCRFYQHKKIRFTQLIGLIIAVMGYISIYLAPAQWGKGGELSLVGFGAALLHCFEILDEMRVLVAAFIVLLILNVYNGAGKKRVLLAVVFFLGSMCANFILIFAASYPHRVSVGTAVLLITADAVLLQELQQRKKDYRAVAACMLAVLLAMTPVRMLTGLKDIYETYVVMKTNEEYLVQCAEDGIKDITLPVAEPETMYSIAWGVRYLVTDTPNTWPNNTMAVFYNVDSILGTNQVYIQP